MESHGIWKAQKSTNPVSMFFFKEENSPSFSMLQKNKTGLAFSCGFVHFGSRGLSECVTEIHECDGLGKRRKLRATKRNNSQLCRASDVGSCSVRVGSGVQTDATTPNDIQQGVQTDATCNIQQYWELRAIQQCCVRLPRALQGQGRQNQAALSPSKFFGQLFIKIKTKIPRSVGELRFIRIVFIVGSEMKILKVFLDWVGSLLLWVEKPLQ